jgi:hypothetical protein
VTEAGTQVLRQGIVGSQSRQDRLRASLDDADYDVLGRALTALSAEAQKMLAELKEPPRSHD